jgi:hypothetical protein
MYNIIELQSCLSNAVAYKQNKNPRYPPLEPDLISTGTGLVIKHRLVTAENINQTLEGSDPDYYDEWSLTTVYNTDDLVKVTVGQKVRFYKSIVDGNQNNNPIGSPNEWIEFDPVSEYLREIRNESINEAVEEVMIRKKIHEEIKEVFENVTIHKGAGRLTDKEVNQSRFVGYEITILGQDELTTIINKIGLQFDGAESFDLLVFHSSRLKPVLTIPVTVDNTYIFDWVKPTTDAVLKYSSDEYETGGQFYIGYKQSDIVGQAIVKNIDVTTRPCHSCNRSEGADWEKRSKFMRIRTFYIPESEMSPEGMWDIENTRYVSNTNWGLNLDLSMRCDLTDYLCRNANMMANVIKLKTEINIIEGLSMNTRENKVAKNMRVRAMHQLSDEENKNRLPFQYASAIKALNFDLTELGSVCFPCQGPRRIKRGVV